MIIEIIGSFFAGLGFGVVFNIHGKQLVAAAVGGTIGYTTYAVLTSLGVDNIMALFLSSMVFSTYSEICARRLKTPVIVFLIIANTVIGIQFLTQQQRTKRRYQTLIRIGASYKSLCYSA